MGSKKKKWAKGRVKEKKNNAAILFPKEYESAIREIPRMKTITVAAVSEKLRVTGSLATKLIKKMADEGTLTKVAARRGFVLYRKSDKQIAYEAEQKRLKEEKEAAAAKAKEEKLRKQAEKKAAKLKAKEEKA